MSGKSHLAALQADLSAYRDYLAAERGMAKNTVLAYEGDLRKFQEWSPAVDCRTTSRRACAN